VQQGGRTSGGCLATVEVALERETPKNQPPQAGTPLSSRCKRARRILSGQPEASAALAPFHIRASDAGRHERRKRKKSLPSSLLYLKPQIASRASRVVACEALPPLATQISLFLPDREAIINSCS
jgi:hypothetical protein